MRKLGQIGRFEFLEASRSYKHAAAVLDWAEVRYDQPISESDIEQIAARECWADMASLNMQLHGDLISSWQSAPKDSRSCAPERRTWRWMRGEGCTTQV